MKVLTGIAPADDLTARRRAKKARELAHMRPAEHLDERWYEGGIHWVRRPHADVVLKARAKVGVGEGVRHG